MQHVITVEGRSLLPLHPMMSHKTADGTSSGVLSCVPLLLLLFMLLSMVARADHFCRSLLN